MNISFQIGEPVQIINTDGMFIGEEAIQKGKKFIGIKTVITKIDEEADVSWCLKYFTEIGIWCMAKNLKVVMKKYKGFKKKKNAETEAKKLRLLKNPFILRIYIKKERNKYNIYSNLS